jgi:hypothetical protein
VEAMAAAAEATEEDSARKSRYPIDLAQPALLRFIPE